MIVTFTTAIIILLSLFYVWRQKYGLERKSASISSASSSAAISSGKKSNIVAAPSASMTFINKMKTQNKKIVIFYGSQTGTAEDYASRLARELASHHLPALTADLEDYEMADLSQLSNDCIALFLMATYGEGEPTDNAITFFEWLKEQIEMQETTCLENLRFAVFGLGNKTYDQYNVVGKTTDKYLEQLGATRFFERGEGDDDGSLEEDYLNWKEKLLPVLCQSYGIDPNHISIEDIRSFSLKERDDVAPEHVYKGQIGPLKKKATARPAYDLKHPYDARIVATRELFSVDISEPRPDHLKAEQRNCMHIEFGIQDSGIKYNVGDHVGIYPANDASVVEKLGLRLKLTGGQLDRVFEMTSIDPTSSKKHPFPCPTTYRTALTHYLDIMTPPRGHILKLFADYAKDDEEKTFLLDLCSSQHKQKYLKYVENASRTILEILEENKSVDLPVDLFLELLPRLQCRYYSVSSSPKVYPDTIHITATVLRYRTSTGRVASGVATTWLHRLVEQFESENKSSIHEYDVQGQHQGTSVHLTEVDSPPDATRSSGNQRKSPASSFTVPIFVRSSSFKPPRHAHLPIVMIGPGTGIAPFRGFIQERRSILQKFPLKPIGETWLFYGCRRRAEDFLYAHEWGQYLPASYRNDPKFNEEQDALLTAHMIDNDSNENNNDNSSNNGDSRRHVLDRLICAFSREQSEKIYVQNKVWQYKDSVWELLTTGKGSIYICGDAKNMARDVHACLCKIAVVNGQMTEEQAQQWVKTLKKEHRLQEDVWS